MDARTAIKPRKSTWCPLFFKNGQGAMKKLSKFYQKQYDNFSLYVQAVGYQKGSQYCLQLGVKQFFLWLENQGIYSLQIIKLSTIKAYHQYLENRPNKQTCGGLSSKMIRDYLWTVSLLFKTLEQSGQLSYNPMSGYELPKVENQAREILSFVEISQLYEQCDNLKERCILHLYYGLGLRRSEGIGLNLSDLDYKNGWLYIQKGKGGKGRNMPLTPRIKQDFKNYLLLERPRVSQVALLLNRNQKRLSGQSALHLLRKLLKKAGITKRIDLHCLRHSIATHLINQGMPLEQVRNYLGHAHLESTQRYVHYDYQRLFTAQIQSINRQKLR